RLSGEDVLRIVDSVSGDIITELRKPVEPDWESAAAWSTDNRFFVYAPDSEGPATLVFYDTATNAATTILIAEDVWDIRVR
ncbi:MAG: hypothetical protein U9R47_09720, partial [Actinomycetota bacterium]|nr:hypothetical protein [Actinomycetota bacterium]